MKLRQKQLLLVFIVLLITTLYLVSNIREYVKESEYIRYEATGTINGDKSPLRRRWSYHRKGKLGCGFFKGNREVPRTPDTDCNAPFVTEQVTGRLGNGLCTLMTLWLFRKYFGIRILISDKSYADLSQVFDDVSVPHGYDDCFRNEAKGVRSVGALRNLLTKLDQNNSSRPDSFYQTSLKGNPCSVQNIVRHRDELRSLLIIKPALIVNSQWILRKELKARHINPSTITLVSVHVRRTDYIKFSTERFHTKIPDLSYYLRAFNFYRRKIRNPLFVVISDDIEWCKQHLDFPDTIFPGSGNVSDPALDFVTITQCDHHIIGFGTFAITSAFIGRGTIVYDLMSHHALKYGFVANFICSDPTVFIPV